ncbi:MAG: DegV family protein [Lachnospiraceae bacterium]|nr:DegV family protein [Lachnospiraceae bacterium]MDY3818424.1 DegV family protein [Lachnospiraceae bacterium]
MIKIISDSTCDLSKDILEKYDVDILPLHIILGDEEYLDGKNITPEEIYRWADEHATTPKTSAPALEDAINLMKPYIDRGDELICFSISNSMSSSGQVMMMAAEELEASNRVHVIDSANLSTGIGLLVVEAAILAKEGKRAAEIVQTIEEYKPYVRASFVVDTLVYLHRGGRCSGVAALVGGALKLHPQIVVEQGAMHPAKKYRGKIKTAVLSYVKDQEEGLRRAKKDRIFITHSGCDVQIVGEVRAYLESLGIFDEIIETRAGGVISSHCGPGTLGVLYIEQK